MQTIRKLSRHLNIVSTIGFIILFYCILFWDYDGLPQTIVGKIIFLVIVAILVSLGWIIYFRQEKIDKNESKQSAIEFKMNVLWGKLLWFYLISGYVSGVFLMILGAIFAFEFSDRWYFGMALSVIGLLIIIFVRIFWKFGGKQLLKIRLKGRHY